MTEWDEEWLAYRKFVKCGENHFARQNTLGTTLHLVKDAKYFTVEYDLTVLHHKKCYKEMVDDLLRLERYYI